ncbi:amino acid ABC transporter substrate-binding protein [Ningiella sp. W23]|uniref:amino acid ABC transporter substrate-binding protein n=1 Tax=Ningiella sp. W23 TaxID=3023715 RepID=UPI003756D283
MRTVAILLCLFPISVNAAVWVITYPQSRVQNDLRYEYPLAMLELALEKTGVRYELKPSSTPMRQGRSVKRLEENLEINVMWSMTDDDREESLLPIRIPIAKGLIGWRFFLAPRGSAFLKAKINEIDGLLEYEPVQGIAWPDTKVLQANGFNVVTARDYLEAKMMVSNRLADFFPRSIIEVLRELESDPDGKLALRPDLALQYSTAMYFFVNKRNVTLAKLIETGLQRALDDGSFDALFYKHFGDTIKQLKLDEIRYFELANPLLPSLTPIHDESLWYKPQN